MENNNYVNVGNIIEQERLRRQAQIAKGVNSDVYDHIEKAHQDDLSKGVKMTDNLSRFADDVDNLNKAETEFLLSKLQRQIVVDPDSRLLKSFKSIAINHLNSLEKAHQDGDMHPNGKWVWVSSANGGKGDWRTVNGRAHKKHQETYGNKEGEKKTIDDNASGASTDALKHAAADNNAKPEVREAAKKELEKRNDSTKVDISKIPDAEFKRITQILEKKNPDHRDAERSLEEEAMSDKELKNFHAVAEHFKNSSNINKLTQEYCRKWAELAEQEIQYRKKDVKQDKKSSSDTKKKDGENKKSDYHSVKELIDKKKNHDVEYSKMTAAQAQKSLVGKTIKIGGKTAKIVNAFKSSGPGANKVYVEAVIGSDYLGTRIQLSTEALESGKTKWDNKYYGTKGQTIEVGDEEPEKKEVTKESFKEFLDYIRKNVAKKDTDEFLNKEYMFMFTVPQKYRSKNGNIHNRVAATLKKLSDVNNW